MPGRRSHRLVVTLTGALFLAGSISALIALPAAAWDTPTYRNPLKPTIPGDGIVESCADPSVIKGKQTGDHYWYMYCTTDPLNDNDKNAAGEWRFHLIPQMRSTDLVHWTYVGDAFATKPSWIDDDAGMWAPEIEYRAGIYYLYYTATETKTPLHGSAIGVATSTSPTGPWVDKGSPVVEPHGADCCGPDSRRWVFDPEVIQTTEGNFIYYGSYFGGISVRRLTPDLLTSDPASQKNVAIANKFEGAEVIKRGSYYYLFVSATDCCRGPITGYSVFVGRSLHPTGPFLDRDRRDLNDNEDPPNPPDPTNGRAGGTPFLSMSSDRVIANDWVGPGHNTVFKDFSGRWWTIYHAVDRTKPYFAATTDFTKRPPMLDPIDWTDTGWPVVRGYRYVSSNTMPAPAAQPGTTTAYRTSWRSNDRPGTKFASKSDEFNDSTLSPQWTWVRPPDTGTYSESGGLFRFDTQDADLFEDSNNASVLTEPAPTGEYMVEAKINLTVPKEGCCYNYAQGGLVIYRNDNNFTKLVHVSIWNTRQTEWAKELSPVPSGYRRYGNTIVGPPANWTYLRIVKRIGPTQSDAYGGSEYYTAYTSTDGMQWRRGGTWTHRLGSTAKIGLVSMGRDDGYQTQFDYVRVYTLGN